MNPLMELFVGYIGLLVYRAIHDNKPTYQLKISKTTLGTLFTLINKELTPKQFKQCVNRVFKSYGAAVLNVDLNEKTGVVVYTLKLPLQKTLF